jgi:hypothetical protein
VINTSECVCGITVRKSANIDSLTSSIQHILDHVDDRISTGQRDRVDQRGQPPPPRVRIDVGQRRVRVTNAQQVVEQQHVFIAAAGHLRTY